MRTQRTSMSGIALEPDPLGEVTAPAPATA
jgi:hypothetical protein